MICQKFEATEVRYTLVSFEPMLIFTENCAEHFFGVLPSLFIEKVDQEAFLFCQSGPLCAVV